MHRWRHCSACSKQGQDGPQSKHGTEKRAARQGGSTWNPLESSSKFALRNGLRGRNCCYTYKGHSTIACRTEFRKNKRKLEKSKSQDHKNYHNTKAFLFEAPALLFIPGWEVFISQLETYIELTGTTQNCSGQMRDGHLFAGRAWTSWTKPLQINMISHNWKIMVV